MRYVKSLFSSLLNTSILIFLIINMPLSQAQTWREQFYYSNQYYKAAKYDSALFFAEKALILAEKEFGGNDSNYAETISSIAFIFDGLKNSEEAKKYYLQAINLRKQILGENHPDFTNSIMNLARFYEDIQNYSKADSLYSIAIELREKAFGKKNLLYANAKYKQALFFQSIGNYSKAEPSFYEVLKIRKEILGEQSAEYAATLNNLAGIYYELGNYIKAEPMYIEALNIRSAVFGEESPEFATSSNNLAGFYYTLGNYSKAEPLFMEALKIRKKISGAKNPGYASTVNNLAALYEKMGNYTKAELLYTEALNIKKEILGENNPKFAVSLNNLAGIYLATGNYDKAEPLLINSLNIYKNLYGEKNPDYITSLNNLGSLYSRMGNYSKAEPLFMESANTTKEILGSNHPDYALCLNNLANLYTIMRDLPKAEPLFLEVLKIRKEALGEYHPDYASALISMANYYVATEKYDKAEPLYLENCKIRIQNIRQNFSFLSEKEKETYWSTFSKDFSIFNSFVLDKGSENPEMIDFPYNNQLVVKGLLLNSAIQIKNEIIESNDTILINQYNTWLVIKENIGKCFQYSKEKLIEKNINLESLENIANMLEKKLSLKSKVFASDIKNQQITWQNVRQNLGPHDAAIEFIQVHYYDTKLTDTTYYCALILRKEYKHPILVKLCTESELEKEMITQKRNVANPYQQIWKPIDSLLKGTSDIYISLSGLLNKISFNALSNEKNQMLIDRYKIHYINSTRQLVIKSVKANLSDKSIVIFGGIKYDRDSITTSQAVKNFRNLSLRCFTLDLTKGVAWSYLEGTLKEASEISTLFNNAGWNVALLSAENATEEEFKNLKGKNSPVVIHISSHGYFFPDPKKAILKEDNLFIGSENPLYRSGLIFAGANKVWTGGTLTDNLDDGILTAYEVSNLHFGNTELVVLSACETGLGDIKSGEGVYGLQRSFQIAGVKSIIMSLWKVPDKQTAELMKIFYTNWLETGNKFESFHNAQKIMSENYSPFYWAAFVLLE